MGIAERRVAHVWRRLGFGPAYGDVEAGVAGGTAALIADLTTRTPTTAAYWNWPPALPPFEPYEEEYLFYARNVALFADDANPLQERLTWMLMGLLVITRSDHIDFTLLKPYAETLRAGALGSYNTLLHDVTVYAGMQWYLNGFDSTKTHPNENLARELLELFSLGPAHAITGAPNYVESDVKEIARALTGYQYNWGTQHADFNANNWDNGNKSFLGGARGAAAVAEVMLAIQSHPGYPLYVARRMFLELVGLEPDAATLASLAAAFGVSGDLRALATEIANTPAFLSDAAIGARVKCPMELVAGAVRALKLGDLYGPRGFYLEYSMTFLQQTLFEAPNVNGWPQGRAWLHPGTVIGWSELARSFSFRDTGVDGDGSNGTTRTEDRSLPIRQLAQDGVGLSNGARAELCLRILGLYDAAPATYTALADYAANGSWNHLRACGMVHLALMSPDYLVQ